MILLLAIPFVTQALLMILDEFRFHRRRGLGGWERWGHPLDTLSVLLCYAVILFLPPEAPWIRMYLGLAAVSCLLVTKDEWVHARENLDPLEHWLHSVLFLLHPVVLGTAGFAWAGFDESFAALKPFLPVQAVLTLAFGALQLFYWNSPWRRRT